MLKSLRQYVRDEVSPRAWAILFSSDLFLSATLAFIAVHPGGSHNFFQKIQFRDMVGSVVAYAAIALGFCLAGLTLVLTLPNEDFAKRLAKSRRPSAHDSYSNLLFVFSWTALVHWSLIVASIITTAWYGIESNVLPLDASAHRRFVIGVSVGLLVYGMAQFLITLLTLSQVGRVYIKALAKGADGDD